MEDKPVTREVVEQRLARILVDYFGVDENEIRPEARLKEDFAFDSLEHQDFVMRVEKACGIDEIPVKEAINLTTYKSVIDYVCERLHIPQPT